MYVGRLFATSNVHATCLTTRIFCLALILSIHIRARSSTRLMHGRALVFVILQIENNSLGG
jgi:hypothetical protein